jgi:hypothetical protein
VKSKSIVQHTFLSGRCRPRPERPRSFSLLRGGKRCVLIASQNVFLLTCACRRAAPAGVAVCPRGLSNSLGGARPAMSLRRRSSTGFRNRSSKYVDNLAVPILHVLEQSLHLKWTCWIELDRAPLSQLPSSWSTSFLPTAVQNLRTSTLGRRDYMCSQSEWSPSDPTCRMFVRHRSDNRYRMFNSSLRDSVGVMTF